MNIEQAYRRFNQDPFPTKMGNLASSLAQISSFLSNPLHAKAVEGLLEEAKFFIEWTAPEAKDIETQAFLVEVQVQLALWQRRFSHQPQITEDTRQLSSQARRWSDQILAASGLLDKKN